MEDILKTSKPSKEDLFENWKKDLEQRLQEHLIKNPELIVDKKSISPISDIKYFRKVGSIRIVEVIPDSVEKDLWYVYEGGIVKGRFTGPLAQRDAVNYANKILNEEGFY